MERDKKLARQRALVILQVRSGTITAKEGAKLMGVSRKSYYEWEDRALRAMALSLENRPSERPSGERDREKEALRERVLELEKKLKLAEETMEVREMLSAYESFRAGQGKKNRKAASQSGKRQ